MLLYAHAYPSTGDPHELVVDVPALDDPEWPRVDGWPVVPSEWLPVTDASGKAYEVRSYPCGQGCHCAAQIRPSGE